MKSAPVTFDQFLNRLSTRVGANTIQSNEKSIIVWTFEAIKHIHNNGWVPLEIEDTGPFTGNSIPFPIEDGFMFLDKILVDDQLMYPSMVNHLDELDSSQFIISNSRVYFKEAPQEKIQFIGQGFETDDEGYLVLNENSVEAVVQYVVFMFKTIEYENGELNRGIYLDVERRWQKLCGNARALNLLPNNQDSNTAQRTYHARPFAHSPSHGHILQYYTNRANQLMSGGFI